MDVPIVCKASFTLAFRVVSFDSKKRSKMCNKKSTINPIDMASEMYETALILTPQSCKKPNRSTYRMHMIGATNKTELQWGTNTKEMMETALTPRIADRSNSDGHSV
mmetsp:Transcript_24942/g.60051  ORF Transcript_24942/g.60051 Transcript_24942/m.60051 type:complete len:107 (+) Transcript_24942:374-694(+)